MEAGRGVRIVDWSALFLGGLALSLLVAWKQFEGPVNEATLRQADLGRQLANGEGISSSVTYPQAHSYIETRLSGFEMDKAMPELYKAPFYSMVISGSLRFFPESMDKAFFAHAPMPANGYEKNYFLQGLNPILFWLAVLQKDMVPQLYFLSSGASSGFTLSLLDVNRLRGLMASLRGTYDEIIFDSPRIIGVSDSSMMASVVSGWGFVADSTSAKPTKYADARAADCGIDQDAFTRLSAQSSAGRRWRGCRLLHA